MLSTKKLRAKKFRKRDRNRAGRQAQRKESLQPPTPRFRFVNLGLTEAEVITARKTPAPNCVGCDGSARLAFVLGWRNANGVAYLAFFCWACVADVDNHLEPFEVEMRIDLAIFEAVGQAEIVLAESEAR